MAIRNRERTAVNGGLINRRFRLSCLRVLQRAREGLRIPRGRLVGGVQEIFFNVPSFCLVVAETIGTGLAEHKYPLVHRAIAGRIGGRSRTEAAERAH